MTRKYIYAISCLIATLSIGACGTASSVKSDNNTQTISNTSTVDMGYNNWHNNVINSKQVINTDKTRIETLYNSVRTFDKKSLTTGWLNEVSTAMAQNPVYRKTILDNAGTNTFSFAETLLKNPKNAIGYHGAAEALNTGLKHIEKYDYQYRVLSTAFEDAARGRTKKTIVNNKNIGMISLKQYASKGNTPSVAEQLLTVTAVKILNLDTNPKLKMAYNTVLSNMPIESCLSNAQRNSAQCKAASYDKNDLSFCMAKHAIGETAQCFSWILP